MAFGTAVTDTSVNATSRFVFERARPVKAEEVFQSFAAEFLVMSAKEFDGSA